MSGIDAQFKDARDVLIEQAEREFSAFFDLLDTNKPYECKQALITYVPLLAQKYTRAASALTVVYYNQKRQSEIGGNFQAQVCEIDLSQLQNSIAYFCRSLFGEDE